MPCSFDIILSADDEIVVRCECQVTADSLKIMQEERKNRIVKAAIFGSLSDGRPLKIKEMFVASFTQTLGSGGGQLSYDLVSISDAEIGILRRQPSESIEVHCGLANFIFAGCQVSDKEIGTTHIFSRDYFETSLDGYMFKFKQLQNYDQIVATLESTGGASITSEVIFSCPVVNLNRVEAVLYDALSLLSFATGVWVGPVYQDMYVNGVLVVSRLLHAKNFPYRRSDHVIDTDNYSSCDIKDFLETTFPEFRRYKKSLGIGVVIEYYVKAKDITYLEIKFLIAALALESLHSYARQHFGQTGQWRRGSKLKETISRRILGRKSTFPRQFVRLLRHFNVRYAPEELRFYGLRNKIVHEGRFPKGVDSLEEYRKLINFIDRILLTILGYRGKPYLNCAKLYARETLL